MFERLQKPFLTVETGEAYQPIRLTYDLYQKDKLVAALNQLKCCERNPNGTSWNWFWKDECDNLHFESLDSFKKNPQHPVRLGTITLREDKLYFNLPSFKRACLAVPFFYRAISADVAKVDHADFLNKVFGLDERLPHGFSELFKEDELEKIIQQRIHDYEVVQEKVEHAATAQEAFTILSEYTQSESKKRLPYAERYGFHESTEQQDPDVIFLGFYIFLRSRELVAIRRWFGETGYTLADAADETVEHVFGGMNIDIIE
ncbi:hypothetical protein [Aquicella lusitana]|uniref:Uncharacterized protein n=1 Tax=Aquicella lusitana TaxID=254246 RepID=A0A370G4I8_9COXI|nr:hypothetical protein [Aquicella lusitana]RDI37504.1 hypothetical protein C8D86_1394 [Aquicella lusitana]VVC72632.1 hypothetical protein AQULUS_03460 [Aquicella lusitana]